MKTWKDIPGWFDFPYIYDEAVNHASDGATFVEIGCWLGMSTAYLAERIRQSGKEITLWCVDTWRGDPNCPWQQQYMRESGLDSIHAHWLRNMQECGIHLITQDIQLPSVQAAAKFEDHSLDFIFIDGAHDRDSVIADLRAWLPKRKPTGWMAGHDVLHPPVQQALEEVLGDTFARFGTCWAKLAPSQIIQAP